MLRIITEWTDAQAELRRICDRTQDDQVFNKEATVREILQTVKRLGDRAVLDYTAEFDRQQFESGAALRVTPEELDAAYQRVDHDLIEAIRLAKQRIEAFHRMRLPQSWVHFAEDEVVLGKRYNPVDRAGIYVPGGRAVYPSTVLMNAIPAIVAGVPRVVMVTPCPEGAINPAVLVAAQESGIQEIYKVGGAQAIGALAYGTETIPKVDVISGPGNIYVMLAKKLVYGTVGIDSLAGPSEVLVIADKSANPVHIAADLLAQAEHDPMAAAVLICTDRDLADKVSNQIDAQLVDHPRKTLTEKAIAHYGVAIVVDTLEKAAELSNEFAPEHLELEIDDPWALLPQIRHAGAIFLGHHTPEAVGDYLAGPNHTLPTSGAARYASPLGVETFLKHSSLIHYSATALEKVAKAIDTLATNEGLPSHGASVTLRMES